MQRLIRQSMVSDGSMSHDTDPVGARHSTAKSAPGRIHQGRVKIYRLSTMIIAEDGRKKPLWPQQPCERDLS